MIKYFHKAASIGLITFLFLTSINSSWAGKKKIVFFYIGSAKLGEVLKNGHTTASDAAKAQVEEQIRERGESLDDYEIDVKNINDFSTTPADELIKQEEEYIHLIKTDPEKYTKLYEASKATRSRIDPLLLETGFDLKKLSDYLEGHESKQSVDVAIGAHWLIPLAISQAKFAGRAKKVKTGWLFTDYYENPLFPEISKCIDMTFLGSKRLVENYQKNGVDPSVLVSSGIPISSQVTSLKNKINFLADKGLDTNPNTITITLAGGGEGLGDFPEIIKSIQNEYRNVNKKIQIVAITAKNSAHFETLSRLKNQLDPDQKNNIQLKIEKVVSNDDILNYVNASNIYIVKSGGLSPTEGAVIGTPMILLDVLGGHESDNAKFYDEIGIGLVNKDPRIIGNQIRTFLNDKPKQNRMLAAQREFKQGRDFAKVAEFALESPPAAEKGCWDSKRSTEGKKLLQEIGLGSRNEKNYLKKGWKELEKVPHNAKNLTNATLNFKKALQINPDSYAANYMLAHVNHLQGNTTKALEYINEAIRFDLSGGSEGEFFHRGIYHLERNEITPGIQDLLRALAVDSSLLPNKKDKNFREKFRGILKAKLQTFSNDPEKSKLISDALSKLDHPEQPGSYIPSPHSETDDPVCHPDIPKIPRTIGDLIHDADPIIHEYSDPTHLSESPPDHLTQALNRWIQSLGETKSVVYQKAIHYRDSLKNDSRNELAIYSSYAELLKQIYSQEAEGEKDSLVDAVQRVTNTLRTDAPGDSKSLKSKTYVKAYEVMTDEFKKKISSDSKLKGATDSYTESARVYAIKNQTGTPAEIQAAYQKLLTTYESLLKKF